MRKKYLLIAIVALIVLASTIAYTIHNDNEMNGVSSDTSDIFSKKARE